MCGSFSVVKNSNNYQNDIPLITLVSIALFLGR